ncbi:MAG TPA: GntR family transcriptional regulator [Solirubrobacteraceae bacterium]|nr:GntR family transcriptional regulator [Solirubrobacteraceae bacterium]
MNGPRLEPLTSPTLVDAVVEKLRESILSGRFAPGERLVEAELARELAISRGPIREALALLEKDGILVNVPRRGKFLPAFDATTIDEIYSLRKVLEPYATELIIASLDDDKSAALLDAVNAIQEAADAGDVLLLAQTDIAFHHRLYELAGHELLRKVWTEAISGKLRMLLNVTIRTHPPRTTVENHRIIVDAILAKNKRLARKVVTEHIDDAGRRARAALEHVATAPVG